MPAAPRAARSRDPHVAADWFACLDAAGVPCEIVDPDFVLDLFDDPELIEKPAGSRRSGTRSSGDSTQIGLLFDFSETPGVVQGPPLIVGQHTRAILLELGYDDDRIDALIEDGVVKHAILDPGARQ